MRRIAFFLTVLSAAFVFVACSDKKQAAPQDQDQKPVYVFTKEDSAEVKGLVDQFVTRMENKDIRAAVEMLNQLKGDSIFPLDAASQRRQAMALGLCQGVSYHMDRMVFNSYKDNEVKLDITFFEKEANDNRPNKTSFYLRPVKFDGKWYLSTKDSHTDVINENRMEE